MEEENEVKRDFLKNSDATGKFVVYGKNGKKYFVEPVGGHAHWGDLNPATGKVEGSYGNKYPGSVSEKDSVMTEENGFEDVVTLDPGESPLEYIDRLENGLDKKRDRAEREARKGYNK